MDRYKFGNNICRLREERGLTQEQFANMLGVTDKAVSKWENGQSIPRMETLESMALVLATPIEALIMAGKDDKTLICIKNDFAYIVHLDIDGRILSIPVGESEWIDINPKSFNISIKPYLGFDEFKQALKDIDESETKIIEKIKAKFVGKVAEKALKYIDEALLVVDCVYECTGYKDGDIITISDDVLDLKNKVSTWLTDELYMLYPKIEMRNGDATIKKAFCSNPKEFVKRQKRIGAADDWLLGFDVMLISYPIRGIYFKYLCKPKTIMRNIHNADKLRVKDDESSKGKKGCGCLTLLLAIPIVFILISICDFTTDMIFIDTAYPALVSSDYSQITYYDEVYTRIEKLPEYATPDLMFGAIEYSEDARMDGLSRFDQVCSDHQVQVFNDYMGNKYLWLITDYSENAYTDDPNDDDGMKDYEDFADPYVYMLEANEKK